MSKQVDERVVSMQFDNKNFESNVQTSLGTIEKLKRSLNLEGASKGLENVDAAAKKVDMAGLSGAVETVSTKFSALQVMGVTALANITNSAVNAGKRIVSALTIDPIKTGLQEYETQINAVQTILANTESKGTTLDDVNSALDALNTYADKTIYNFTEMTRNIGTFTAAGVDLDTSVNAIQGIANLAAVSGSSSQQASTAMYQLSQAMSSCTVKLMDWNSVVNAGMGGQVFQDALKETARVHGVNVDAMIKKHGSFRETLQEGWITTDILTETLSHFTMAAEKGSKEWEEYKKTLKDQGYSEKQAEAILKMSNTATDAATKVKTATQLWDTLKETAQSGWTQTWELIVGDFEEAKNLFSMLYETISPIIEASSKARNDVLKGWADAGGREDLIESLRNIFDAIGSIAKPIKEAFNDIFPISLDDKVNAIVNLTKGIKEFTEKIKLNDATADKLKRTFKGVFALLDIGVQVIKALFGGFSKLVGYIAPAGEGIFGFTAGIGDFLVKVDEAVKSSNIFSKAIEKITDFLKPIAEGVKTFASSISESFEGIADTAEGRFGFLTVLGNAIKSLFTGLGNIIGKVAPWIMKAVSGIGDVLRSLMDKIASSIQGADYGGMFDVLNGGIFSAIGIFIAKFIKSGGDILDGAGGFLENINSIFEGVGDALNAFTESIKAETLKKIATAIAILAASLFVLALIDSDKLTTSLLAISALFAELMGSMAIFGKIADGSNIKSLGKISRAMIGLSTALLVLSVAMKIMSTMSWEEMGVGLIATVVGLGALVGAVRLLPEKNVNKAAKAIKKLSSALLVFAVAMKIMGSMSWEEMAVGLVTVVVGLGAMVGALHLLPKNMASKAAAMIALSAAMVVLASALKIMATMSWDDIARSLVALAGSLLVLAGAMALMKKAIPGALAMMIVAPALVVLAAALKIMSTMSWSEIARGLVALAGSLLILSGAMLLMKSAIPGALAMLIIAPAIVVLAGALMMLGSMSWSEIARGLVALAGGFAVIGLAGLILKPVVGTILALSAAIALLGVACAAIGAGVLMIGIGLTSIAAAGGAAALALTTIVSSIIGLIPFLIEQIGVGIIRLCEVIAGSGSAICAAFTVIVLALVDAIVASVPAIVEGVLILVEELLKSLVAHTPTIVGALFDFLIGLINAVAEKLPDLIQAGVNLLMAFFQGVIDALNSVDPGVLVNGILAVGLMTALMVALAAIASLTPAAMVGVLGFGAVIVELTAVLAAIGALSQIPGLEWLVSEGGDFLQKVGTAIGQFLGGIVGGIAQGVSSALPQIGSDLSAFMTNAMPFINGIKMVDSSVLESAKSLVGVILALTGANLIESLTSWLTGGSSLADFGAEIAAFAPHIKQYADTVKGIDASAVEASVTAAQCLSELAHNLPNSGGLAGWFAGENDIGTFGAQLVPFGMGMKAYSMAIAGFNAEAVIASANAATALADMTSHIPNQGGMVAWFTGENSVASFADDLVTLGLGLRAYSMSIIGFNAEAVIASANAAKALADMTSNIPNSGGMVAWFTGENSVAAFSDDLVTLGQGLSAYSVAITGFNAEAVIASANAAQALADMTSHIPNQGGMAAWFTGDNSISKFASDLVSLGMGLKMFSLTVTGINPESIVAAAQAGKALTDMTTTIPNEGGVVAWFTGDNSISKFASQLPLLGTGLAGFSSAVSGIIPENVISAANAAKALAEMASVVPTEGGIKAWFTGESAVSKFAGQLPGLGKGLKGFSDSVAGISPENITAAANAAKSLGEMASVAPENTDKIVKFGENLDSFGGKLKSYFVKMTGVTAGSITASSNAINAVKNISTGLDAGVIKSAAKAIDDFADTVKDLSKVKGSSADGFAKAVEKLAKTNINNLLTAFENAGSDVKKAGQALLDKFIEGAESRNSEMSKAGKMAIEKFVEGLESQKAKVNKACETLVKKAANAITAKASSFTNAGKDLGAGLVNGINAKQTAVYRAGYALGQKAVQGEKDGQKSKSPSKLTTIAGKWIGEGLIIGMEKMANAVYASGYSLGETATDTISSAISKVADMVNSDIDAQPTIRPVLDLTDVRNGANAIGSMLTGRRTLAVNASSVGGISASMAQLQNGGSNDVVSAINSLRKDIADMPHSTYQINGITYDDGTNVSEAIKTLVRAAKIERRV